jgi:chemotaxis protein MotB
MRTSRRRQGADVWPGFVDALSSILLVFVFMVLIFVAGQFSLTELLTGRDKALAQLNAQIGRLADTLSLEIEKGAEQEEQIETLQGRLKATLAEREQLLLQLAEVQRQGTLSKQELDAAVAKLMASEQTIQADKEQIELKLREIASLQEDINALRTLREQLEAQVAAQSGDLGAARDRSQALEARLADEQERTRLAQKAIDDRDIRLQELSARIASVDQALVDEKNLSAEGRAQVDLLNTQIAALREQLSSLSAALDLSQTKVAEQKVQIDELGSKLNLELARKVKELGQYRSEFFGKLREVLGNLPDIRIVGDRFLFQSELLFDSGSAEIGPAAGARWRNSPTPSSRSPPRSRRRWTGCCRSTATPTAAPWHLVRARLNINIISR